MYEETFTLYATTEAGAVPVSVARKRVKNLNLRIRRDASAVMSIPARASRRCAQRFIDRRASWIAARIEQLGRCDAMEIDPRSGDPAALVPLWGALVEVKTDLRGIPADRARALLDEHCRAEVAGALPAAVARLEAAMGVHASSWQVRTMRSRWGSCTPATGAIRISSALAAYPPACLEYVVAHELVHLIEPSHGARFHVLLDRYFPQNRMMRACLRRPPREVAKAQGRRAADAPRSMAPTGMPCELRHTGSTARLRNDEECPKSA